jgi:acetyltransferase-like isoleucine patch superfamily enzyme
MSWRVFLMHAWRSLQEWVAFRLASARLSRRFPTCRFYPGIAIDPSSSFGKYNVIFRNVAIINSVIGDHTFIQKNSFINDADIGKFCSIAMGVQIGLAQHAISHVSSHPAFYLLNTPLVKTFSESDLFSTTSRTMIGHDVWIGQNAMIMSGMKVGTGAIIGAGCVVTKDVPEYAIVIGVPAKTVRFRFDENIRNGLLKTEWWNMSDEWLERNYSLFSDPLKLIGSLENRNG